MFQEDSAVFQEDVSKVNLHRYNQPYLCPKSNNYGDIYARKIVVCLQLHVLYLFNMMCYPYTAQVCPRADRHA